MSVDWFHDGREENEPIRLRDSRWSSGSLIQLNFQLLQLGFSLDQLVFYLSQFSRSALQFFPGLGKCFLPLAEMLLESCHLHARFLRLRLQFGQLLPVLVHLSGGVPSKQYQDDQDNHDYHSQGPPV